MYRLLLQICLISSIPFNLIYLCPYFFLFYFFFIEIYENIRPVYKKPKSCKLPNINIKDACTVFKRIRHCAKNIKLQCSIKIYTNILNVIFI